MERYLFFVSNAFYACGGAKWVNELQTDLFKLFKLNANDMTSVEI